MALFPPSTVDSRRARLEKAWNQGLAPDEAVLVHCGSPRQIPGGLDQTYAFVPHPHYLWLTGLERARGVCLYSPSEGWRDFVPRVSREEIVWEGGNPAEFDTGFALEELEPYVKQKKFRNLYHIGAVPAPDHPAASRDESGASALVANCQALSLAMDKVRRVKDADEIRLIQKIAAIAAKAYERMGSFIRPGLSELEVQAEFEATILKGGSHRPPYSSIVGSGPRAGVLHALPTSRIIQDGELVLIDAGAEISSYCVDITRVFPANGRFSAQQKELHQIVLEAQTKALALARPGAEWSDLHKASARVIAEGLKQLGLLAASVDTVLETGAISVFYPHGLGHLVGLRVRDTGCLENTHPREHYGVRLRVDLALQENHLLTFEPGCYFIPALYKDAGIREKYRDAIRWDALEAWENIGGIRLEDNVLIRSEGLLNLTAAIPK